MKQWKDIKIGDKLKDGSVVTDIHRTHVEECCKVIYSNDREFICSYRHILLVNVKNLPKKGKKELDQNCTYVPLEESYSVETSRDLSITEKLIVEQFLRNEKVDVKVDTIQDAEVEVYDFYFDDVVRVYVRNIVTKWEKQKVDDNTYWLNCRGIAYLMDKYGVDLYCNDLILNKIEDMGELPCFCISTNTGRYET